MGKLNVWIPAYKTWEQWFKASFILNVVNFSPLKRKLIINWHGIKKTNFVIKFKEENKIT